jgi:hypothetical protein
VEADPANVAAMRGLGAGRWWALGAVALAVLTLGLDTTVLSVALPTLSKPRSTD